MSPRVPRTRARDEWLCGYAAALATLCRYFHEKSAVRNTLRADGITLAQLSAAGCAWDDLKQLVAACK